MRGQSSGVFLAQVDDYVPVFYRNRVSPDAQPGIAHAPSGFHVVIEAMPGAAKDLCFLDQTVDAGLFRDGERPQVAPAQQRPLVRTDAADRVVLTNSGAPPLRSVRICPGASSSSLQTTCLASSPPEAAETALSAARLEAIEGPRVVVQYLALQVFG